MVLKKMDAGEDVFHILQQEKEDYCNSDYPKHPSTTTSAEEGPSSCDSVDSSEDYTMVPKVSRDFPKCGCEAQSEGMRCSHPIYLKGNSVIGMDVPVTTEESLPPLSDSINREKFISMKEGDEHTVMTPTLSSIKTPNISPGPMKMHDDDESLESRLSFCLDSSSCPSDDVEVAARVLLELSSPVSRNREIDRTCDQRKSSTFSHAGYCTFPNRIGTVFRSNDCIPGNGMFGNIKSSRSFYCYPRSTTEVRTNYTAV